MENSNVLKKGFRFIQTFVKDPISFKILEVLSPKVVRVLCTKEDSSWEETWSDAETILYALENGDYRPLGESEIEEAQYNESLRTLKERGIGNLIEEVEVVAYKDMYKDITKQRAAMQIAKILLEKGLALSFEEGDKIHFKAIVIDFSKIKKIY